MMDYFLNPDEEQIIERECPKCKDVMELGCWAFKCLGCGEILDLPEPDIYEYDEEERDVGNY